MRKTILREQWGVLYSHSTFPCVHALTLFRVLHKVEGTTGADTQTGVQEGSIGVWEVWPKEE